MHFRGFAFSAKKPAKTIKKCNFSQKIAFWYSFCVNESRTKVQFAFKSSQIAFLANANFKKIHPQSAEIGGKICLNTY